jgi:REP-associated tyrosine transposase
MTNHLHALVQVGNRPLGHFIQSVAKRFSRFRHKALNTSGHLFERRYHARLIDVDAYFLAVLRYVHLNPVKAYIVSDPAEYRWSSHRAYLGRESIGWLSTQLGLSMLSHDPRRARATYAKFIREPDDASIDLEEEVDRDDPRILGDAEFAGRLAASTIASQADSDLAELASRLCQERGISIELLRSRSSQRSLTPVRLALLERAEVTGIANLSQVARFVGRDPSTLCKLRKAKNPKTPVSGTE